MSTSNTHLYMNKMSSIRTLKHYGITFLLYRNSSWWIVSDDAEERVIILFFKLIFQKVTKHRKVLKVSV